MWRLNIFVMFLCIGNTGVAFEGYEHKYISSIAFDLAVNHIQKKYSDELSLRDLNILHKMKNGDEGVYGVGYSQLVEFADYQLDPFDYFKIWGEFSHLPDKSNGINTEYIAALKHDIEGKLRLAHASHLNMDHFQEQLMFTYWWWHEKAIDAALKDKNLYVAFFLSAYADHFLEDFFAPGHIQTPRDGMHDVAALGIHDNYNEKGALFSIRNHGELVEILASNDEYTTEEMDFKMASEKLLHAIRTDRQIELKGDNYLRGNHEQELLMVLVVARSIIDVYESYVTGIESNSFTQFFWKARVVDIDGFRQSRNIDDLIHNPVSKITYGEYTSQNDLATVYSPVLGVMISNQAKITGHETNRLKVDVEIMPLGVPPPGNYARDPDGNTISKLPSFGLGIGYSYMDDENQMAHGPTMRFGFPIRGIDTTISANLAYREYRGYGEEYQRFSPGLSVEMGFGLVFLNLSISNDYTIKPNGNLDDGVCLSSGVSILFPASRVF